MLRSVRHRPWPLQPGPWIMEQHWHNLLLAHWPVPIEELRPLIPEALSIDTFEGQAWLGVIAFRLHGVRLRGFPPVPLTSSFPEINLRTYVTVDNKPGVYFITMDADNRLGTELAKLWFRLPYSRARVSLKVQTGNVEVSSKRTERGLPQAEFSASYGPIAKAEVPPPGGLDYWLAERYCYYRADARHVYRCQVHHLPWRLQRAKADIRHNTLASSLGVELPTTQPVLHYAHHMKALIWPVKRVEGPLHNTHSVQETTHATVGITAGS